MRGVGNWPCWVSFGFYAAVASISGWYFFIMYDDIAGLKPDRSRVQNITNGTLDANNENIEDGRNDSEIEEYWNITTSSNSTEYMEMDNISAEYMEMDNMDEDFSHLKYYMAACFWICWGSCAPNLYNTIQVLRGFINFYDDIITQIFIMVNYLTIVINTLDVIRTHWIYIPPVLRLGLFGAGLFMIHLELVRLTILFFFPAKGSWFNLRNSVITSVLVVSSGFLFALLLITIDPSLNKQAPPQKPHGFWQSGAMLSLVIGPTIGTLMITFILLLAFSLKLRRSRHDTFFYHLNGNRVKPITISVFDSAVCQTTESHQQEKDLASAVAEEKYKEEMSNHIKSLTFLTFHVLFFVFCLFVC
ncbi:uncharacterized protein LOC111702798 isoform X5 [Eurytemora carolleeae]|uniref:uncharacterized protein LOC111702798 isoform X5 n=1 Tax=Eurytemora carolleeae TaxID=1294199 RepID=UPI000C76BB0F|nr:uncharacterized protein LOC111702798 isoform X5 [Eurytemora carolleeae]|eukprot:XP_023330346.1 uncharacterized protein LOC111702798 isoform X5 [Eurytemora affinis]